MSPGWGQCHQDGDSVTKTVTKSVTKTVTGVSPKWGHTKDTITKDKKDNKKPPVVPQTENPVKMPKRATQFPADFTLTENHHALASKHGVNLHDELMAFSDYHQSKGSTFKNWQLAFNTWLRNSAKFGGRKTPPWTKSIPNRAVAESFNSRDYGETQTPSWVED